MDKSLAYLRESLSNWTDTDHLARSIFAKLSKNNYEDELSFTNDLTEREVIYLNDVLEKEMEYAREEKDEQRLGELNQVYEQLL